MQANFSHFLFVGVLFLPKFLLVSSQMFLDDMSSYLQVRPCNAGRQSQRSQHSQNRQHNGCCLIFTDCLNSSVECMIVKLRLQPNYIMTQHSWCCRDALQRFTQGMWLHEEAGSPQADEEERSPQADEEEGLPRTDEAKGSPQADEEEGSPQTMDSPAASIEVDLRADSSSPAPASPSCCPALRACGSSPALSADGSSPKPAASPGLTARAAADRAVPRSPDDDGVLQGRPLSVELKRLVNRLAYHNSLLAQCLKGHD